MKQIRKYIIAFGRIDLQLSKDADLLCVQAQKLDAVLYVAETPGRETKTRKFAAVHTGDSEPVNGKYIGTAMLLQGNYVLHLYELRK